MADLHFNVSRCTRCETCGARNTFRIDYQRGERTCTSCGIVSQQHLRVEHISYHTSEYAGRVQSSTFVNRTYIGAVNVRSLGAKGQRDRAKGRKIQKRLKQNHLFQSLTSIERHIIKVHAFIDDICYKMHLGDHIVRMAKTFSHTYCMNIHNVKKTKVIACVSVLITSRVRHMGITLKQFEKQTNMITVKELGKFLKIIDKEMKIQTSAPKVTDMIARYGCALRASRKTMCRARRLAKHVDSLSKEILKGRSPISLVAAVLYISNQVDTCLDKWTTKHVAKSFHIAENTLVKCISDLVRVEQNGVTIFQPSTSSEKRIWETNIIDVYK